MITEFFTFSLSHPDVDRKCGGIGQASTVFHLEQERVGRRYLAIRLSRRRNVASFAVDGKQRVVIASNNAKRQLAVDSLIGIGGLGKETAKIKIKEATLSYRNGEKIGVNYVFGYRRLIRFQSEGGTIVILVGDRYGQLGRRASLVVRRLVFGDDEESIQFAVRIFSIDALSGRDFACRRIDIESFVEHSG